MTPRCDSPIADETLLDYWVRERGRIDEDDPLEEHLFACAECSARLERLASIGTGLATLLRQGRVSGIVSRAVINRLQLDGVRMRLYSVSPGQTVPCTVFPDDDLVVTSLRADLSGVDVVTLAARGAGDEMLSEAREVPVSPSDSEVLWALPGALVRALPSMRVQITLVSADEARSVLGEYTLDHSAPPSH